ncbi:MAG TPA: HupE/UreJ family protein [Woeseiaceae bacterium]|nr:HupE/UreJ family protein [Woeseiaceae bacterium]
MTCNLRPFVALVIAAAVCTLLPPVPAARAHEIPSDVVVQSYLKPEGDTLNLLVRVPLEAMRDVNFPLRGPGYLDIGAAGDALHDAATVWIANSVRIREGDRLLTQHDIAAVRLSLPAKRPFRSYEAALRHVTGPPLTPDTELYRDQAMLDVLLRYPIRSADSAFAIDPGFRRLGLNTTTVLHFIAADGRERLLEFWNDPGMVELEPSWFHALAQFIGAGFDHILDGTDHLLFLLCLIVPFRRIRPLVTIVTSFTVAHSITLIGSALGAVPQAAWFPALIESLIAVSIVYMALENIVGARWERRWAIAFGFGLVHGYGFSFALSETLQFAGSHLLTSLLGFNLGVELGQLLVILIVVPLLNLVFRAGLPERMGTIVLSAILAHSGWHWMSERFARLSAYSFTWPQPDAATLAGWMRMLMMLLIIGGAMWGMYLLYMLLMRKNANGGDTS